MERDRLTLLEAEQGLPVAQGDQPKLIETFFVRDGICPTEKVQWVPREVPELSNGHRYMVEAPEDWSERSYTIAAVHYLAPCDGDSIRSLILRVTDTLRQWALNDGVLTEAEAWVLRHELTYILLHRLGSFNSPVYYNMGVDDHPQCSACFLGHVDDSMESITDWGKIEARIFQRGSGAGVNWSRLRSSREKVRGMGLSSGPVAFASALDNQASKIKSGGRKRRAARMDILNIDHPDVLTFIRAKSEVEEMARSLVAAGWSTDMNDPKSVNNILPHQSTNLSVRITDAFMRAYADGSTWDLKAVTTGEVLETLPARDLMREIAQACWACGDPGVQFQDTIQNASLIQDVEVLTGSNPCSEFLGADDTSCNLASINVLPPHRKPLKTAEIRHIARTFILAQDVIVDNASYPSQTITENTKGYRDLGLGWTNLGAWCMYQGLAYDSDEARRRVASLVSLTTAAAYEQSFDLSLRRGAFKRATECQNGIAKVFATHAGKAQELIQEPADTASEAWLTWRSLSERVSRGELPRNASVSVSAPCGTIGLLMDCDTTGCEPPIALQATKKLSYGGSMDLVVRTVEPALQRLGYHRAQIAAALEQIQKEGHVEGVVREEHLPVFDTAFASGPSKRAITASGHLKMVAALQPHISMGLSKTINLPTSATVEDVERSIFAAWKTGIKCLSLYRDGSKASQAVYANGAEDKTPVLTWGARKGLPETRPSLTHCFEIDGTQVYLHVGLYEHNQPGEIFFQASKQGSTINGLLDSLAIAVSHGLQHGVPLSRLVNKYKGTRFAPEGWVGGRYYNSIVDYVFQWLEQQFLADAAPKIEVEVRQDLLHRDYSEREQCRDCGHLTVVQAGKCRLCTSCGTSSGGCS